MDGEAYLLRLIDAKVRELGAYRSKHSDSSPKKWGTAMLVNGSEKEVRGAVEAMLATDEIDPARAHEITAAFRNVLIDTGWIEEYNDRINTFGGTARVRTGGRAAALSSEMENWKHLLEGGPSASELLRVMALGPGRGDAAEGMTVISIELWSDHFLVNYLSEESPMANMMELAAEGKIPLDRWQASDDTGGRYDGFVAASDGGKGTFHGRLKFKPSLLEKATVLTLMQANTDRPIDLPLC